ncbi:MAG: ribulose-phosphate 3-epimerase [Chloroflexota bacterium]
MKIAPSIVAADFARLGEQVADVTAAGADWLHLDVMDGRFVPNISFGPAITRTIRGLTDLPLDVHLMIEEPERYIGAFATAGATGMTVHWEACTHVHRVIGQIKEAGCRAGLALNPGTPLSAAEQVLDLLDLLLVMTVDPGFSGQSFIARSPRKVRAARELLDARGAAADLEVDGGVGAANARILREAGATVFVSATYLFSHPAGLAGAIAELRRKA